MRTSIFLLALICASACKTPCSDPTSIASQLATALGTEWKCQRIDLMQADFAVALAKVDLCQNSSGVKGGAVGSIVCPLVVAEVQSLAAGLVAKPEYLCDASLVGATAAADLEAACNLIPF